MHAYLAPRTERANRLALLRAIDELGPDRPTQRDLSRASGLCADWVRWYAFVLESDGLIAVDRRRAPLEYRITPAGRAALGAVPCRRCHGTGDEWVPGGAVRCLRCGGAGVEPAEDLAHA